MTKTQPHYRARYDRQFAPPPALPGSDELERTARQVYIPGRSVHRLALATTYPAVGRVYSTDCGRTLFAAEDAVLTTAPVDCSRCNGTAVTP